MYMNTRFGFRVGTAYIFHFTLTFREHFRSLNDLNAEQPIIISIYFFLMKQTKQPDTSSYFSLMKRTEMFAKHRNKMENLCDFNPEAKSSKY